jgi:hypothetical protein
MNNIINSSGIYDITSYNSTSNNATILSSLNVGGSVIGPDTISSINNLNTTTTTIINNLKTQSGRGYHGCERQGWHSGSAEKLYPTTPVCPSWGE